MTQQEDDEFIRNSIRISLEHILERFPKIEPILRKKPYLVYALIHHEQFYAVIDFQQKISTDINVFLKKIDVSYEELQAFGMFDPHKYHC